MKKSNLPTPNQIYLSLKAEFDLKDEVKEPISNSERLEKLYAQWKEKSIKLDDPISNKLSRPIWFRIVFWMLIISAVSVLINKIHPFLAENINDLLTDNLSRLTFLVVIVTAFLVGKFIYKAVADPYVLCPKRVMFAFMKNKKKKSRFSMASLLLTITVVSLFLLGYVWTMIISLSIAIVILAAYGIVALMALEETKNAFEKIV